MYRKYIFLILIPALILVACAPVGAAPQTPTVKEPLTTSTLTAEEQPSPQPDEFPAAVLAALQRLATEQNIDREKIQVIDYEPVDWPDACLGLAEPGELCLQIITPGWRIELQAGGQKYVYHTDENGDSIRLAPAPVPEISQPSDVKPGASYPPAVQAAVDKLSSDLELGPEEIEVVSAQQTNWPDSCLGLAQPGEMCLQVITPGWRVILSAQGTQYELHTNEDGSVVRLQQFNLRQPPPDQLQLPASPSPSSVYQSLGPS